MQSVSQQENVAQLEVQGAASFSLCEASLEASLDGSLEALLETPLEGSRKLKLAAPWFFL